MIALALFALLLIQGPASQTFTGWPINPNNACVDGQFGILRVDDGSAPGESVGLKINGVLVTSSQPRAICAIPNIEAFRAGDGSRPDALLRPGARITVEITPAPLAYYVKSMTVGNLDLTKGPVDLPGEPRGAQRKIEVVLTKTRPAGTPTYKKVSGRILGLDMPRRAEIRLVLTAVSTPPGMLTRPGAVSVPAYGKTGDFEIPDLPPGHYRLRLAQSISALDSDFAESEVTFDVGESDVTNLELKFEPTPSK